MSLEFEIDESTLQAALDGLALQIAQLIADEVHAGWGRGSAPRVRSGELDQSVRVVAGENGQAFVEVTAPYAAGLEQGDHPFLAPAAERAAARLTEL